MTASRRVDGGSLAFGVDGIDARLAEGGMALAALHEVSAASAALGDDAAATLFIAGIVGRAAGEAGTVLWAMSRRDLFAPGIEQAGLPPARLLQAEAGRDPDILAVMEDGLRHGGLAAVVGEVGRVGLAATRRLQLAAEEGGTIALLLRRWRKAGNDPLAEPSCAMTRWRIGCIPSAALPVAGVGRPCWTMSLARQRGGEAHEWMVEGCDAEGRLAVPAGLRGRSAAADRCESRQAA